MKFSFTCNANIDKVMKYLIDTQKFVSVHPLINKMQAIDNEIFKVDESIKIGFINYNFSYKAKVSYDIAGRSVKYFITINAFTSIELSLDLREENGITFIDEQVSIKSIMPIKSYMHKLLKKTHLQLFNNIEQAA